MITSRLFVVSSAMAALVLILITVLGPVAGLPGQSTALAGSKTIKQGFFYNEPSDGTTVQTAASRAQFVIASNTGWRDDLRDAGYTKPVLKYFLSKEAEGPGPYKNSSASCDRTYDPLGNQAAYDVGDFCAYVHSHEDWFLHNGAGDRLYLEWDVGHVTYIMNPASQGWREFARKRFDAKRPGFSGIFLDNVELTLYKSSNQMKNSDGAVREFKDDTSFRNAMHDYLSFLGDVLRQNGSVMWANLINDTLSGSAWDLYLQELDGGFTETFATGYHAMSADKWNKNLSQVESALKQGKGVFMIGRGDKSDTTRQQFAFASYLLVMQPDKANYFRYAHSDSYRQWWQYSNYDVSLGSPKGPRYQSGSLWRRDFACGYVTVDAANRVGTIKTTSCN